MLPELGRSFPTNWRGTPSHMSARDVPLWFRFLDAHAKDYDAFFYDVALGGGTDPGPDQEATYRFAFLRLTRLRADALGVNKRGWTLFEVRPNAGSGALGAIITYAAVWETDPPDKRPLQLVLITDQVLHQLEPLYAKHGVTIVTV